LEQHAQARDPAPTQAALPRLDDLLGQLITGLERWQAQPAPATGGAAEPAPANTLATDASALAGPLARLRQLVLDCDSEALDWWQQHEAVWNQGLPPALLRKLSTAMMNFDFDAALTALDKIAAPNSVAAEDTA
jgi:hypothetical protein